MSQLLADSQVYLDLMSQPPAFRSDDSPPVPSIKTVGTIAQRQFATDRSKKNMKTYQISEDRVVVVKKNLVTIKQKDSDKFSNSHLAGWCYARL